MHQDPRRETAVPEEALAALISPFLEEELIVLDSEGCIAEITERLAGRLGADPQTLRGASFADLTAEPDETGKILSQLKRSGGPVYSEVEFESLVAPSLPYVGCFLSGAEMAPETAVLVVILKPVCGLPSPSAGVAEGMEAVQKRIETLQHSLDDMATDLTQRTLQLAEERSKLRAVISQMPSGLLVLDKEGQIAQTNPATRQLLEREERDLLGKRFRDVLPELATALTDPSRENDPFPLPKAKCQLGQQTILALSSAIRREDRREPVGTAIVLQDITREEELARMREEIISIVSHELRSPLTTVTGYLEIVLRGEVGSLEPEQTEFLQVALDNSRRLVNLINDLLDLSRLEAGKVELSRTRLDLAYLVNFAFYNFQKQAEEKGLHLEKEVPQKALLVSADDQRMIQVVVNLGSNAVKYTPPGGVVRFWAREVDGKACLGVSDTGYGIAKNDLDRLFTKFFRTREATRRQIGGSGLGLSITREIVQAHGGRIHIESEPGEGSTFQVILDKWE